MKNKKKKTDSKRLVSFLSELNYKARKYGTRSKEVYKCLKKYSKVKEFPDLAHTILMLTECEGYEENITNSVGDGSGPIPDTWKGFFPWAFSPFRILLLVYNTVVLAMVAAVSQINIIAAVCLGLCLLWLLERIRE